MHSTHVRSAAGQIADPAAAAGSSTVAAVGTVAESAFGGAGCSGSAVTASAVTSAAHVAAVTSAAPVAAGLDGAVAVVVDGGSVAVAACGGVVASAARRYLSWCYWKSYQVATDPTSPASATARLRSSLRCASESAASSPPEGLCRLH